MFNPKFMSFGIEKAKVVRLARWSGAGVWTVEASIASILYEASVIQTPHFSHDDPVPINRNSLIVISIQSEA